MTLGHLGHSVVVTARICAPTVLQAAFGGLTAQIVDRRLDYWSGALLARARVEVTVTGRENVAVGETFVVMSNHQSFYDIPVLYQALQLRLRMVAKKELFKIPLFSQAMRCAGFVEVDRANRESAIRSLKAAEKALASGTSIWIAPEGTRSPTGKLGAFKKGGFELALGAGARILPVTIDGTRNTLLARGLRVHDGARVRVTISPPINPKQYGRERRDALMETVWRAIAEHLPQHAAAASDTATA